MLDMPRVREVFEASTDFTVGIEEEFAILDPRTLSLDHRFEELRDARAGGPGAGRVRRRRADPLRDRDPLGARRDVRRRGGEAARGALAAVRARGARTTPCSAPPARIRGARGRSSRSSTPTTTGGCRTGSSTSRGGTTPSACTCTWACGGAERAVRVCDRLRAVMPELLAISANSPFLDGRHSGLHSARTQIFTKSFPRCGIPDAVRELAGVRGLHRLPGADATRSPSSRRCGGACGRTTPTARSRCGSATRRRAPTTRRRWRR